MSSVRPERTAARRPRSTIRPALVVAVAAILGALGYLSLGFSSDPPAPSSSASTSTASDRIGGVPQDGSTTGLHGALGEAGGAVPGGVTVFDDQVPAVGNLEPGLLHALRQAATEAAGDGVELQVNSGWRSPAYQEQLLREAVAKYGSEKQAARWVATPNTSAHVSGHAVDIGPSDAAAWLSRHGARFGLCQTYSNESWHYELRPRAVRHGCPPRYADPTHDPRMQQ